MKYFDQKFTWATHIKIPEAKCTRALNILKYLSHTFKSCTRQLLIQLYESLIRSRLDYGVPVYNLANRSVLTLLNIIQASSHLKMLHERLIYSLFLRTSN